MLKSYKTWILFSPLLLFMFLYLSMNLFFSNITDKHNLPIKKNIKAVGKEFSVKKKENLAREPLPPEEKAKQDSLKTAEN